MNHLPNPNLRVSHQVIPIFEELQNMSPTPTSNPLHTRQGKLDALQALHDQLNELMISADLDVNETIQLSQQLIQIINNYTHTQSNQYDPFMSPSHQPHRGSDVETFIRNFRDQHGPSFDGNDLHSESWYSLDNLLDEYRLRADIGITLTDPLPNPAEPNQLETLDDGE